uniref:FkbM family methyltransferase n=1 Tax=Roseihalotalea indica TaxID=2867963 RepID=A0AA49JF97_9BACT|nr:FkbM family methyltransferase [Tunicatimonas sp. TK19036]
MKYSKDKVRRYSNLTKNITNWASYLWFKAVSSDDSFNFQLRNSFSVNVPRQMLSSFKESFFDEIYLKHIPDEHLPDTKENLLVVDIGANVGYFSLFMFYYFPNAKVLAFEPMPFNYSKLQKYQNQYPAFDFTIYPKAVSHQEGELSLNASTLDEYTTMASIFEHDSRNQQITVETITLQDQLEAAGYQQVDFLKLDCEGSEYAILYNLPQSLLQQIKIMSIETHQGTQPDENLESLEQFLRTNGFATHSLSEGKIGYIWAWNKKQ